MSAIPHDVIQRTAKPNLGQLLIVESVDDKTAIAYVPLAPERYRVRHDDYQVIGPAAIMNVAPAVKVAPGPVSTQRRPSPVAQRATPPDGVELPPPLPPPPRSRQPFGRFVRPFYNPDIVPDGAPIRENRPAPAVEQPPAPAQVQPQPPPEPVPVEEPPRKKRKILDVEI